MSSIFASIVLGMFVGLILILIYETFIYFSDKYKSYKVYKQSDKRIFDCSEVVWFNGNKFYITHWKWWSHTFGIDSCGQMGKIMVILIELDKSLSMMVKDTQEVL